MRALILAALLVPSAYALEFDGKSIHLTPEEVAKCMMEGGCAVISRKDFEKSVSNIYAEGYSDGEKAGAQSCKKTDWRKTAKREGWDG